MTSHNQHSWRESDDLVAFYLWRDGSDQLGLSLHDVAANGISSQLLKMRMSNCQGIEGHGGLTHASKQTRDVFLNYQKKSEIELRGMVLRILMRVGEADEYKSA